MSEKDDYAPEPDVFPKKGSSGSGGDIAYTVQARMAYVEPKVICGVLLDTRWRTVYFEKSPIGVPAHARYCPWSGSLPSLMSYEAAQALRWWFMANASHGFEHFCLETRIVKHKIKYSYEEESVAAGAVAGSRDDHDKFIQPPPLPVQQAAE